MEALVGILSEGHPGVLEETFLYVTKWVSMENRSCQALAIVFDYQWVWYRVGGRLFGAGINL